MAEDEKNPRSRGYIVAYSLTKPHIYITYIISRFFFLWNPDAGSGPRFRALSWRAPGAQGTPASEPSPNGPQGFQEPKSSVVHH